MPVVDKKKITRRVKKITRLSLGMAQSTTLDTYKIVNDLFQKQTKRIDFLSDIAAEFDIVVSDFDTQLTLQALIQYVVLELRK